jgi:Methyltransferase small domain
MNERPPAFPLHRGSPELFERVTTALRAAGFDETTLCRELKIPSMCELGKVRWAEGMNGRPQPLGRWVGVFLFGERVARADLEQVFPPDVMESLIEVGLLRPAKADPDRLVCPVFLYPVAGFLIASDRHDDPDSQAGSPRDAQPDVVFPGIFGGTIRFLELLPARPEGDALDLCGGCGIGALCLARTSRTALSADITLRATHFAEFNARLNGCDRAQAACGDLYQAVADRQFDVITAHPPYVPVLGSTMVYRDAGDTGEDITRNIVAGLPTHLRPGGQALILCQGRDAEDGPFEQRVRAWLGESHAQFDVVFAMQTTKSLEQEATEMARRVNQPTREELAELLGRFRRLGTRQFVYGALAIHRHNSTENVPCTSRTRLSAEARAPDFDCLIAWHHRRSQPQTS